MNSISVYQYADFREYLKAYFEARKKIDPKFSHRYFSRRIGLTSPNFILMVIQGKRNLTRTLAFKISSELKHDPKESEYFECMVGFSQAESVSEKNSYFIRMAEFRSTVKVDLINENQYDYYSNWYNLVVREIITDPDFTGDMKWLARQLHPRISEVQARHSVELLIKLGLVHKNGKGYSRQSALLSTGPQVSSLAIANFHRTMTQLAANAMDTVPIEDRNITACTVNISHNGFEQIKEIIAECRRKIMSIAEAETELERVYQVNFHLFPVTEKKNKKNKG
jgi:uncharacterized protein (TIGR02147 family)